MTVNNRNTPKACTDPPKRFYHATRATLNVGDIVVPGRDVPASNLMRANLRGQWVWLASAPVTAWGPNVYRVEPIGAVEEARGWYRCKSARVVQVYITEEGARAGQALGFNAHYATAMLAAERAKCETCGQSIGAHAARFVREACDRVKEAS